MLVLKQGSKRQLPWSLLQAVNTVDFVQVEKGGDDLGVELRPGAAA